MNSKERKFGNYTEYYIQTGLNHAKQNTECEDVYLQNEQDDLLFYGLADGQSGKTMCRQGATAVLNGIAEYMAERKIPCLSQYQYVDEIQYELIRVIRNRIEHLATENQLPITEFASTVMALGIIPQSGEYMTVHLGDGGILGTHEDGSLQFISVPENGITRQYTWLTTSKNALMHLRINFGKLSHYTKITMFTDGAETICRGTNISINARKLLSQNDTASRIIDMVKSGNPVDDASCVMINCEKILKN